MRIPLADARGYFRRNQCTASSLGGCPKPPMKTRSRRSAKGRRPPMKLMHVGQQFHLGMRQLVPQATLVRRADHEGRRRIARSARVRVGATIWPGGPCGVATELGCTLLAQKMQVDGVEQQSRLGRVLCVPAKRTGRRRVAAQHDGVRAARSCSCSHWPAIGHPWAFSTSVPSAPSRAISSSLARPSSGMKHDPPALRIEQLQDGASVAVNLNRGWDRVSCCRRRVGGPRRRHAQCAFDGSLWPAVMRCSGSAHLSANFAPDWSPDDASSPDCRSVLRTHAFAMNHRAGGLVDTPAGPC